MKIATLQFSPQVGLVKDNIARADSILSSSSTSLHDIDLLVLPELAFTGNVPLATSLDEGRLKVMAQATISPHYSP